MKENKMFLNVEFSFVYGHVIYSKSMPILIPEFFISTLYRYIKYW